MTLKDLLPGEQGIIIMISAKGALLRRMLDMGISKGKQVKVERIAPLGDPLEIVVKGCHITLRKNEAAYIKVEKKEKR